MSSLGPANQNIADQSSPSRDLVSSRPGEHDAFIKCFEIINLRRNKSNSHFGIRFQLGRNQVSLLEKYNCTEQDARELCEKAGLLSPVYAITDRGGCWFCPNAKRRELRHLYDHHPELWARMLELQALPGKATEKFNRTQQFSDIDAAFRQEDEQLDLFREAA